MTKDELNILSNQLMNCSHYLEFGSGNSTTLAVSAPNIKKITTVESDISFWNKLIFSGPELKQSIESKRLEPLLINIGPTKEWGYPADTSHRHLWPNYSSGVFQNQPYYDLILIDGRFRVACTLQACIHMPPGTRIIIHDFFNRVHYHVVLPFLTLVDRADTLGLFTIRNNNPDITNIMKELIDIYQYQPGF